MFFVNFSFDKFAHRKNLLYTSQSQYDDWWLIHRKIILTHIKIWHLNRNIDVSLNLIHNTYLMITSR